MTGSIVVGAEQRLPQIAVALPPLEGQNLRTSALVLRSDVRSAADAIAQFRQRYAPESLQWYRRYYLAPGAVRGGVRRYALRYAWNMERPKSDRTVGVIEGDDLAAARVLIGNELAGALMTPIRWELCEDRDGEDPIAIGRYDPWSLLRGVTEDDIGRLAAVGIAPQIDRWDFDHLYWARTCPGCGAHVTVNLYAFNVDSAECVRCGIRPFLSQALGRSLRYAVSVTGAGAALIRPDECLLGTVSWMGSVGAGVANLHREELPDGYTPHGALLRLLGRSRLLGTDPAASPINDDVRALVQRMPDGATMLPTLEGAASTIIGAIERGGPFTATHAAMVELLETAAREVRQLEQGYP